MSTTKQRGANPSKKAVAEYVAKLPVAKFTNDYGEKFGIHSDGVVVFLSGDEVRAMVREEVTIPLENGDSCIPLFGPNFNIWSKGELFKLGQALKEVAILNGYVMPEDRTFEYMGYQVWARVHQDGGDAYSIDNDGNIKNAQDIGYQNNTIVWYEINPIDDSYPATDEEPKTLEEAKRIIERLIDERSL